MVEMLVRSLALLALMTLSGPAAAQMKPKVAEIGTNPKSFLFVGNSFYYYNNSMHSVFLNFVRAADKAGAAGYRATSATISGSGLNWHDMEAYLKPGSGMASYSFVGDNEVVFNTFDKPYDVVIMNDCSQCPVHPKLAGLFHEYAKKHADTVRARGAVPVLFMTWAYADKPEMTQGLAEQYTKAGNDNNALVVPASNRRRHACNRGGHHEPSRPALDHRDPAHPHRPVRGGHLLRPGRRDRAGRADPR